MNTQSLLASLAFGVMIVSTGSAAAADTIDGKWKLVARHCMNGSAPKDAFVMGRDQLEMQITETGSARNKELSFAGEIRVKGTSEKFQTKLRQRGIAFETINPVTGKSDLMIYNQPSEDTLQVFSSGFGADGSCPRADLLKTTYARVNEQPKLKSEIEIALLGLK